MFLKISGVGQFPGCPPGFGPGLVSTRAADF